MTDNENLLYKSEPSIEISLLLATTISMDVLMIIILLYYGLPYTALYITLFSIPFILWFIYIINVYEVKIYGDRIYCKDFKHQNKKLKNEVIYHKDIISIQFTKGVAREAIDIETNNGKYIIGFVDYKKIIPELKKQLKDKWKE
jgi:hypothetical protein